MFVPSSPRFRPYREKEQAVTRRQLTDVLDAMHSRLMEESAARQRLEAEHNALKQHVALLTRAVQEQQQDHTVLQDQVQKQSKWTAAAVSASMDSKPPLSPPAPVVVSSPAPVSSTTFSGNQPAALPGSPSTGTVAVLERALETLRDSQAELRSPAQASFRRGGSAETGRGS